MQSIIGQRAGVCCLPVGGVRQRRRGGRKQECLLKPAFERVTYRPTDRGVQTMKSNRRELLLRPIGKMYREAFTTALITIDGGRQ